IFAPNMENIQWLKQELSQRFDVKDMGEAKTFLGMEIHRTEDGIKVNQNSYINNILNRFGMASCNPTRTPMVNKLHLEKAEPNVSGLYQAAIGSLLYLVSCTRPDIAYAVNYLSRFCLYSTSTHYKAVERVFHYLKRTADKGLLFKKSSEPKENEKLQIIGFSDADWAGCKTDRKSTSGYVLYIEGVPIAWR